MNVSLQRWPLHIAVAAEVVEAVELDRGSWSSLRWLSFSLLLPLLPLPLPLPLLLLLVLVVIPLSLSLSPGAGLKVYSGGGGWKVRAEATTLLLQPERQYRPRREATMLPMAVADVGGLYLSTGCVLPRRTKELKDIDIHTSYHTKIFQKFGLRAFVRNRFGHSVITYHFVH